MWPAVYLPSGGSPQVGLPGLVGTDCPILPQRVATASAASAPPLDVLQAEIVPLKLPLGEVELAQLTEQDPMLHHVLGQTQKPAVSQDNGPHFQVHNRLLHCWVGEITQLVVPASLWAQILRAQV